MHENVTPLRRPRIRKGVELARVHVTIDAEVEQWLRDVEHANRVSRASIVEVALQFLRIKAGVHVGDVLKSAGATLRRG